MKGFTLIEAALATALLSAGLIGVLFAYQGAVRSSVLADQTVVATNIARRAVERIVADRIQNGYAAALTAINTTGTYDENPVSGFSGYVLDSTALEVDADDDDAVDDFLDASAGSGYARVTAQVSWNNGTNLIRLISLLADYPAP